MFLSRGVKTEDLKFIRRPKPCKALLEVGDRVHLNGLSSRYTVGVLSIVGSDITIESQDWKGDPEALTLPRICLRKARFRSWLHKIYRHIKGAI
jgi:hypothetical protein